MAQAYTPGLTVASRMQRRVRRMLPIAGEVLVKQGEQVSAQQAVARTFLPGEVYPVNLANILSISASDLPECLLVKEGDPVEVGDTIARTKGIFGFFKSEYQSKVAGTIESVSTVTGQMMVRGTPQPIELKAFLAGEVIEVLPKEGVVIEATAAVVQGIFGIGGEAYGTIRVVCDRPDLELTPDLIQPDMRGQVLIGGARMTGDAVRKAVAVGASAVISGGMDDQDLKQILGYDLGVAITGSEKIGTTLVITEGFGEIAMAERTYRLLTSHRGEEASVNGATQIRAGVMRPEVLIPLKSEAHGGEAHKKGVGDSRGETAGALDVGRTVRVIREPYFGQIGTVASLPHELQTLDSGSKARVLEVEFSAQRRAWVPRANVELIEVQGTGGQ